MFSLPEQPLIAGPSSQSLTFLTHINCMQGLDGAQDRLHSQPKLPPVQILSLLTIFVQLEECSEVSVNFVCLKAGISIKTLEMSRKVNSQLDDNAK